MKNRNEMMGRRWEMFRTAAHSFYRLVLDFVYPPYCLLCREYLRPDEELVCHTCWRDLPVLDQLLLRSFPSLQHAHSVIYLDFSFAVFRYDAKTKELIHSMKYDRKVRLCKMFGHAVAGYLANNMELRNSVCLVPVPLHARRLQERGYNQSLLLARAIADKLDNSTLYENVLARTRYTLPQAKMNREERLRNVRNAFVVQNKQVLKDRVVALVDDVMTTGSTLNECARVVRQAGAKDVFSLTIARA